MFVCVAESGPTISLYNINRLVFVISMDVGLFEVRNEFLCIARWTSFFKMPYHGSGLVAADHPYCLGSIPGFCGRQECRWGRYCFGTIFPLLRSLPCFECYSWQKDKLAKLFQ